MGIRGALGGISQQVHGSCHEFTVVVSVFNEFMTVQKKIRSVAINWLGSTCGSHAIVPCQNYVQMLMLLAPPCPSTLKNMTSVTNHTR